MPSFSLLETKLEPPPLPAGAIERERVAEVFEAVCAPLVLVVAGPGYGKTVAVRQATDALGLPVGWVSLDPMDDESSTFWAYVIEALQRASGFDGEAASMLAEGASSSSVVDALVGELAAATGPVCLVLDDLQVITSSDVLSELTRFIEHLPTNLRVIAASRADPPLPIARWRLNGRAGEVRQEQLRFSADEAQALTHSRERLDLDRSDVEAMVRRTEGWAAALQLTLLSLRGRDDATAYLRDGFPPDRMISDYLLSEVLDRLPLEDRQLLLDLSVLEDFDGETASYVTERPDAGQRIRTMESAGLLLLPVDEDRQRLRFHQLLRELLQQELRWREPGRLPMLHRRAAEHLARQGNTRQAVPHHLAAGQLDEAFGLVNDLTLRLLDRGDATSMRVWLRQFPDEFLFGDLPRMLSYATLLIVAGHADEAAEWIDHIELALDRATHDQRVTAVAQRTILHIWRGDHGLAEKAAAEFLGLHGDERFRGPVIDRMPGMLTRLALYAGDLDEAARWLEVASHEAGDSVVTRLIPEALAAEHAVALGDLDRAEERARIALSWASERGIGAVPATGEAHGVLARVAFERGDLTDAETSARAAVQATSELRITSSEIRQRMFAVRITATRYGPDAGFDLLAASRKALGDRYIGASGRQELAATRADLCLQSGDLVAAEELVRHQPDGPSTTLLRSRLLHQEGRFDDVIASLADVEDWHLATRLDGLLLLARCQPSRATTELVRTAAAAGLPRGFVRPFLDQGSDLIRLLRLANKATPTPELEQLLAIEAARHQPDVRTSSGAVAAVLTAREQDLLTLLPTHLTYREMADELCVSINTLKSYQKALFRKLQVPTRSDAVAVARSSGLLAP